MSAPKPAKKIVYVVQRFSWVPAYIDTVFTAAARDDKQAAAPVRAFAKRADAEKLRDELEAEARHVVPPYRIGGQNLPGTAKKLTAAFRKLGLEPPADVIEDGYVPSDDDRLVKWWYAVAPTATPEQRAGVWEILGVQFYEVVEVPVGD